MMSDGTPSKNVKMDCALKVDFILRTFTVVMVSDIKKIKGSVWAIVSLKQEVREQGEGNVH